MDNERFARSQFDLGARVTARAKAFRRSFVSDNANGKADYLFKMREGASAAAVSLVLKGLHG